MKAPTTHPKSTFLCAPERIYYSVLRTPPLSRHFRASVLRTLRSLRQSRKMRRAFSFTAVAARVEPPSPVRIAKPKSTADLNRLCLLHDVRARKDYLLRRAGARLRDLGTLSLDSAPAAPPSVGRYAASCRTSLVRMNKQKAQPIYSDCASRWSARPEGLLAATRLVSRGKCAATSPPPEWPLVSNPPAPVRIAKQKSTADLHRLCFLDGQRARKDSNLRPSDSKSDTLSS